MMKLRPKGAESSQPRDVRLCRLSTNGAQESPWVVCIVVFRPEGALKCQPRAHALGCLRLAGMRPVRPKALYYRAFALTERHWSAAFNIPRAQPWADVFKAFSLYKHARKSMFLI